MAFVMCDDHSLSVEADGMDVATAKQNLLGAPKPNPTPIEKELNDFGREHRDCNLRIVPD
ncbi:MAG TPA: hypothetical protein VFB33_08800 [Candidatus Binataceae bacterium]|jgi:hypothetical protein|nr:hypothetical protein [Candidatus Binataceae bacterium]